MTHRNSVELGASLAKSTDTSSDSGIFETGEVPDKNNEMNSASPTTYDEIDDGVPSIPTFEDSVAEKEDVANGAPTLSSNGEDDSDGFLYFEGAEKVALCCVPQTNILRRSLLQLTRRPEFEYFILFVIFVNAALMAVEDPMMEKPAEWQVIAELISISIFSLEMIFKIIAFGFIVGRYSYLHSGWNVLDFFIVTTSLVQLIFGLGGNSSVFRLFRMLRPLRTINRFPALKRVVLAILLALPQMHNLVIVIWLFFMTFGTIGVNLWQGVWLQRCHTAVPLTRLRTQGGQGDF